MKTLTNFYVFKELLLTDLSIFKNTFYDRLINLTIWISSMIIINRYLMPAFGLSTTYGNFILAGLVASAGLFEVFPSVVNLVADFEGDQIIHYHMTLPLPTYLVWLRLIMYFAISAGAIAIFVLPIGQVLLWNDFNIMQVDIVKFAIVFVMANMFYGVFTLWITSKVKNMGKISNVWMRFVFPVWFFGCFQFSWQVLFKTWPALAYINLLNPLTYSMEGFRAAILGQPGYLPFWHCMLMLFIFWLVFFYFSTKSLNKRLDLI